MKRFLSATVLLSLALSAYACSSSSDGPGSGGNGTEPGAGGGGDGTGGDGTGGGAGGGGAGGGGGGSEDLNKNPIEGIEAAKPVLETGVFTDGPVWNKDLKVMFFTAPLGEGALFRMRADGSALKVRDGARATGQVPIGNTIDELGQLITIEAKRVMRGTPGGDGGGVPEVWAGGFSGEGGARGFDTLNDGVVGKDGTLYATDPGYFETPITNRLYRITKTGEVQVVEEFADVPRPNGIALTPDATSLYVGFAQPVQGTLPFIRKYIVNPDGTLGEHSKWIDLEGMDDQPDGIEVDQGGNVYVAVKTGVNVYKADGTKLGTIAIPEQPTAMAFGGEDLKTLYVTTQGVRIYQVKTNVPGIAQ